MNKAEHKLLIRLHSVFQDIPLPINGANWTKSATPSGFISHGKDIAAIKDTFLMALYHIRVGEHKEAEEELTLLERYIELRGTQDWGFVPNHPSIQDIRYLLEEEKEVNIKDR